MNRIGNAHLQLVIYVKYKDNEEFEADEVSLETLFGKGKLKKSQQFVYIWLKMINVNIYNAKEEGKTGPKSQGYSLCELQSCTFDFIAIYNISTVFFKN